MWLWNVFGKLLHYKTTRVPNVVFYTNFSNIFLQIIIIELLCILMGTNCTCSYSWWMCWQRMRERTYLCCWPTLHKRCRFQDYYRWIVLRMVSLLLYIMYRQNYITKYKKFSRDVEMNNKRILHLHQWCLQMTLYYTVMRGQRDDDQHTQNVNFGHVIDQW